MWFTRATPMIYYRYNVLGKDKNTIKDSVSIPQMPANALNVGGLMEAEGPHAVKNLGNIKGLAYRVEFKKEFKYFEGLYRKLTFPLFEGKLITGINLNLFFSSSKNVTS